MPAYYSYTVEIRIPNTAVARGAELDREQVEDVLREELGVYEDEAFRVLVKSAPKAEDLERERR